ncbi:pyroglutamyl-peptidase I [Liquorilactobacillus vini]|uniref:Pyrrolidone-carboxylate peptidase n=1 Tax=Liquorilactobacillus vini DSM 20605 TaxID=1133569 RepID=A0A0R2BZ44_9LACO|nr:pyroglutamyl-peptidase I [Liquorilactobacillus vini]KRM84510.1 pyrrolidone-carboxylate peptidase [Liquorilactobacillus vini DSM 20605]
MKLLLTGFDPFGKDKINPAIEAVKKVPDEISGLQIAKLEIPTVFFKSAEKIHKAILSEKPDFILNIGQAGGRYGITPERVAINFDDARIPDNEGQQPKEELIHDDGENAYFTQLPVKEMSKAIKEEQIPSYVSTTAGAFVCNHVMYQVQYMIHREFPNIKGGFMHIPFLPSQVVNRPGVPSLSLADDVRGITAAVKVLAVK